MVTLKWDNTQLIWTSYDDTDGSDFTDDDLFSSSFSKANTLS